MPEELRKRRKRNENFDYETGGMLLMKLIMTFLQIMKQAYVESVARLQK